MTLRYQGLIEKIEKLVVLSRGWRDLRVIGLLERPRDWSGWVHGKIHQ